mgnify:CR=1 FL=1
MISSQRNITLGLDFGTTNTVVSRRSGDDVTTLNFNTKLGAIDTVRTVLRRFSRRFPELDAALWNPDRTDLGEPIEVAHAVLFLASEEASYITGHTLAVAGGR